VEIEIVIEGKARSIGVEEFRYKNEFKKVFEDISRASAAANHY
jgi:hypothetical protein